MKEENKLTPMMEQYREVKKQIPDCLLFYRLGDFYEMFFEDALTASRELELTLTGRACGENERAPMCGVPYHAAETYIQRLVQKGYKVAICEQMEDPRLAKGLVKREITRIVTPGTAMNADMSGSVNNYIMSIQRIDSARGMSDVVRTGGAIGLSICDISTGEFLVTEFEEEEKLMGEIAKFHPSEILVNQETIDMQGIDFAAIGERLSIFINPYPSYHFQYQRGKETVLRQFHVLQLEGLGLENMELGVMAAGALLDYLAETQKRPLEHINKVRSYSVQDYMVLDMATRRNLELTETLRDKTYKGSLLWVLDKTKTAMGGRLLRKWLEQPLIHKERIEERLSAVDDLVQDPMLSEELKESLSGIYDMERLMGRISYGSANARDLTALKISLQKLPEIRLLLQNVSAPLFVRIADEMDLLTDIADLLEASINEDAPISVREGDLIRSGYNEQVDRYRSAATDGKTWLAQLEAKEKQETGIKNLKVGYNRVFGYYLEVSKGQISMVPERYIRKQTLVNGERYITEELKQIEDTLLGAKEKGEALEYELFCEIRSTCAAAMQRVQKTADLVAMVDAIRSLADTAYRNHYVRPEIREMGEPIDILDGRHPVVEKMLPENSFIENDTHLDLEENRIAVITGPNMGGKSTYMRQVAAIVLLAQIGSFIPAREGSIGIVDRIFTRVGASDDLSRGQSTFMVEMSEVSNILRHATKYSLLILDEIGRGTSTFDGLSLAWAVVEYITDTKVIGAKTLFATHYHELTQLEGQLPGIRNYCVAIKESGEDVIFLHKISAGSGDQSYGIEVARLAGLPKWVLTRATEILTDLLGRDVVKKAESIIAKPVDELSQLSLFEVPLSKVEVKRGRGKAPAVKETAKETAEEMTIEEKTVLRMVKEADLDSMTPLMALKLLDELKSKLQ